MKNIFWAKSYLVATSCTFIIRYSGGVRGAHNEREEERSEQHLTCLTVAH